MPRPERPPLRSPLPPRNPRDLGRWFWQLVKDVVNEYRHDGVGDLAASITFWAILSVPALVLAIVSALGSLETLLGTSLADDVEREVITFMQETFRDDSSALVEATRQLFDATNSGVLTVAAVAAFYSLSRGFGGLIRALDSAYDVPNGRPWWHSRIVAVVFGLGTVVMLVASSTVIQFLPEIGRAGLGQWLVAPATIAVLLAWVMVLFHYGPNHRTPWRYDLPGAVVTAAGWLVFTRGYAVYVGVADRGNAVQTTVGAVLLAMTLVYLLSVVLLVGAELNAVLSSRAGVIQERPSLRDKAAHVLHEIRDRT